VRSNRVAPVNVREEASINASIVVQIPNRAEADVYEQIVGEDTAVWYFILGEVEGEPYEGWVRSDLVVPVEGSACPPLE
jgi:hypothetical protein